MDEIATMVSKSKGGFRAQLDTGATRRPGVSKPKPYTRYPYTQT